MGKPILSGKLYFTLLSKSYIEALKGRYSCLNLHYPDYFPETTRSGFCE